MAVRAAARELQEAGAALAAAELVWIPRHGRGNDVDHAGGNIGTPHLTSDATRIFAYGGRDGLISFRWDGTDLKTHLKVTGPMPPNAGSSLTLDAGLTQREARRWIGGRAARLIEDDVDPTEPSPPQPPPASLILMAPKGDQALAMVGMDFYTITVPQVGANPPTVSVAAPASAAVPVRKLNEIGGEFPAWSGDGRRVMWALGNALWTYDLDRAKVVEARSRRTRAPRLRHRKTQSPKTVR